MMVRQRLSSPVFIVFMFVGVMLNVLSGCARFSIREINFYDEKTALENQILGTYREIETEPWLTTSVRGSGEFADGPSDGVRPAALDRDVLFAFRERILLADDLDSLKSSGLAGEGLDGYLVLLRPCPEQGGSEGDEAVPVIACDELLRRENTARMTIAAELATRNRQTGPISPPEALIVLRSFFIKESPVGTLIETNKSEWQAWHGDQVSQ